MGVLPDWMIHRDVKITPFEFGIKRPGKISYGVSSYGYDARIGYKFKIFSNVNCTTIDPKNWYEKAFVVVDVTPQKHQWEVTPTSAETKQIHTCSRCLKWTHYPDPEELCTYGGRDDHILIPPNSFALGETIEEFEIPRDCLAICVGKSTLARCGIIVNVTPLEPEWRGKVTVEISNTMPLPAKIYAGEGIMQVIFLRSDGRLLHGELDDGTCRISYADKSGKYQDQTGITQPKVDGGVE